METLRNLKSKHQELKERIHSFRMPLSRPGVVAAGLFYFTLPVVGGCFLLQMTNSIRDDKWGVIVDDSGKVIGHKVPDAVMQRRGACTNNLTSSSKPIESDD